MPPASVIPPQYITHRSQVQAGQQWLWSYSETAREQRARYDNTYPIPKNPELNIDPSNPNYVPPPHIRMAWYARITNFWQDALWAEPPLDNAGNLLPTTLHQAFSDATRNRSIHGLGAVALHPTTPQSIDPQFLYPFVRSDQPTIPLYYIVAYPWHAPTPGENNQARTIPNRIDIIAPSRFTAGPWFRTTHLFHNGSIGERIGQPRPVNITNIVAFGDWRSDYALLYDLIDQIEIKYGELIRSTRRNLNPHLSGPTTPLPSDPLELIRGLHLQRATSEDPEWKYVQIDPAGMEPTFNLIHDLSEAVRHVAALPDTALPTGASASPRTLFAQSGAAKERDLFPTLQKIRSLRFEISEALREAGFDNLDWPDNPFATYTERAETVATLKEAEIVTAESALAKLDR